MRIMMIAHALLVAVACNEDPRLTEGNGYGYDTEESGAIVGEEAEDRRLPTSRDESADATVATVLDSGILSDEQVDVDSVIEVPIVATNVALDENTDDSGSGESGVSHDPKDKDDDSKVKDTGKGIDPSGQGTEPSVTDRCRDLSHTTHVEEIVFRDPGTVCDWNQGGNLSPIDARFQARREEIYDIDLPNDAILCDMRFDFPEQDMRYDDEILLLFNDVVLLASQDLSVTRGLVTTDEFIFYDWDKIVGSPYLVANPDTPPYCLGVGRSVAVNHPKCHIPPTETVGSMRLDISPDTVMELGRLTGAFTDVSQGPQMVNRRFSFVTLGDNNDSDCRHADLTFSVTMEYVVP